MLKHDHGCPIQVTSLFLSLGWDSTNAPRPFSQFARSSVSHAPFLGPGKTRTQPRSSRNGLNSRPRASKTPPRRSAPPQRATESPTPTPLPPPATAPRRSPQRNPPLGSIRQLPP